MKIVTIRGHISRRLRIWVHGIGIALNMVVRELEEYTTRTSTQKKRYFSTLYQYSVRTPAHLARGRMVGVTAVKHRRLIG